MALRGPYHLPLQVESRIPRSTRPNLDPDAPDDVQDETIDDPDEDAMMAMMGLGGFGSTKVIVVM